MSKVGSIQMKNGRWRIYANLKGFRQQWMPLTCEFIADRIRQWRGVSHDPLQMARAAKWVSMLREADTVEKQMEILRDMNYVATKTPETHWQRCVAEWAGWLKMMTSIRFKAPKVEAV